MPFFEYHDTNSGLVNYIEILYIKHNIELCNLISSISFTNLNIPVLVFINWRTAHGAQSNSKTVALLSGTHSSVSDYQREDRVRYENIK
jgi:hypothetical protein